MTWHVRQCNLFCWRRRDKADRKMADSTPSDAPEEGCVQCKKTYDANQTEFTAPSVLARQRWNRVWAHGEPANVACQQKAKRKQIKAASAAATTMKSSTSGKTPSQIAPPRSTCRLMTSLCGHIAASLHVRLAERRRCERASSLYNDWQPSICMRVPVHYGWS